MAILGARGRAPTARRRCPTIVVGIGLMLFLGLGAPDVASRTPPVREYQVKAVFLFNFVQFVDWPDSAFADATTPIGIGVLGNDPFGSDLDEVVRDEVVKGRPLTVVRYRTVDEIKSCHLLYISASESDRLDEILANLNARNILTVGDSANFAARGGMIHLSAENNRIRLRINLQAATGAGLAFSSALLRSATVINAGEAAP